MPDKVSPDFENTSIELSSDLSELWHDMAFDGNSLWDLNKIKEKRRVFQFIFSEPGNVVMGRTVLKVRPEDRLVYFPKGTDLKADHLSAFYMSLSKQDRENFYRMFGKQITAFFTKQINEDEEKNE